MMTYDTRRSVRVPPRRRSGGAGLALLCLSLWAGGALPAWAAPPLRGNLGVHDPSTLVKCKDRYYQFGTGQGIASKSSADRVFWTAGPNVFAQAPAWTTNAVPGFTGYFWAPDIFQHNGRYCLYYAISTWGSQVSAIGLVTNPTLDPGDAAYKWTDQGPVIASGVGSAYNTIDPSVTHDASGHPWMSFGSYWSGIYIVQLDPLTGLRRAPGSPTYRAAYHSSIEASCLYRRGNYYYLFVNWGSCCVGVNSTYQVRVGRSTSVTGPYLDRNGVDLANNGGTLFLEGTGKFTGPGHIGILAENGVETFSYHYYDAGAWAPWYNAYGVADFDLEPLSWTADDWPVFTNDWSASYDFQADARDEKGQYYGLLLDGAAITNDATRGRVLNLNGAGQYVQLPPGVAYARTFLAVVKWHGGGAWQRLFDFGTDTSRYVMLTPSSGNGRLRLDIKAGGGVQTLESTSGLPVGVWTQVAVTLDGHQGVLYVNGAAVATNTSVTLSPLEVLAQTNHLGRSKFTADPDFSGQFASFRAYGRVLSAAEIAAPQPVLAQPAEGSLYWPGTTVAFHGSAVDLADVPLAASALTWTVKFINAGVTNSVLGPISGVSHASFVIPASGPAATNGFYRILLVAADALGRKATNAADIFPASASANSDWAAYYPFTTGAQDASNRFPGTLTGGAPIVTDPTRGQVLELPGSGQYVNLPVGVGALRTFAGWVKWDGGSAWQRVFDFGVDTTRYAYLTPRNGAGLMQFALAVAGGGGDQVIQAPFALPTNAWTHLAVALDGRQGMLYVNGLAVAVNNSVNLLPADVGATRCYLGRSQFPADAYLNGQLDSVRLNSRALSLADLLAPAARITQPAPGGRYTGGMALAFAGTAVDYADVALPPTAFTWSAQFHYDGQSDAAFGPWTGVTNGTFLLPTNGPASTNVFYRVKLQATDPAGNTQGTAVDVPPSTSLLNFETVPAGLELALDGQPLTTPASVVTVAGLTRSLAAPSPQGLAGSHYSFVLWSDGGGATHNIRVPTNGTSFTAGFVTPALSLGLDRSSLWVSWPTWARTLQLASATNLAPPVSWSPVPAVPAASNGLQTVTLPWFEASRFYRLQSP
jgi:hypothetical protein